MDPKVFLTVFVSIFAWVSPRVLRWVAGAGSVAIGLFFLLRGEGGG
jgi:hypothetical protein